MNFQDNSEQKNKEARNIIREVTKMNVGKSFIFNNARSKWENTNQNLKTQRHKMFRDQMMCFVY